jgi:hypothetical protein
MFRQLAKYGAVLIALYIGVANASGLGQVFTTGATGVSGMTKTLQGR